MDYLCNPELQLNHKSCLSKRQHDSYLVRDDHRGLVWTVGEFLQVVVYSDVDHDCITLMSFWYFVSRVLNQVAKVIETPPAQHYWRLQLWKKLVIKLNYFWWTQAKVNITFYKRYNLCSNCTSVSNIVQFNSKCFICPQEASCQWE